MELDELWIINYEDDLQFSEKLQKAESLRDRYKIMRADAAQELFTDLEIPCGSKNDILIDKTRVVKSHLKIPFPIFSEKNKTYRE